VWTRSSRRWTLRACSEAMTRTLFCTRTAQPSVYIRTLRSNRFRSASLAIRDILFPALGAGLNGAECGHLRPFFRTTGAGLRPDFGSFSGSQGPPSLTQPNHGHFGTDVGSSHIQRLCAGRPARS
jgi:hypothetical protein